MHDHCGYREILCRRALGCTTRAHQHRLPCRKRTERISATLIDGARIVVTHGVGQCRQPSIKQRGVGLE